MNERNQRRGGPGRGPSSGPGRGPARGPARGPSRGPARGPRRDFGDRPRTDWPRSDRPRTERPGSDRSDDNRPPRNFARFDGGREIRSRDHQRPEPKPGWRPADQGGETSWEKVADWYEDHLRNIDTHHSEVLAPGVEKMLADAKPGKLLDIGCGPGYFCRYFSERGWKPMGIDVSPAMIDIASSQGAADIQYVVGDAETLHELGDARDFDAAISVVALQNITHADRAFVAAARRLKMGGVLVGAILHPAFRFPRQSSWGWDEEHAILFRRVDRYMSKDAVHIVMHPGADPSKKTTTLHRPISWYVNALGAAGFAVDRMEEWCSHRQSTSGHRRDAENKARTEIPLFLAFRAIRLK